MEYIGFVKAPIDPKHVAHIKKTMEAHGALVLKVRPEDTDSWWSIFFPEGARRVRRETKGDIPRYTIYLPDGYKFLFEAGKLDAHGVFIKNPVISLDAETKDRRS